MTYCPRFQQFVLGFNRLDGAFGILADDVFHYHHVAGRGDAKYGSAVMIKPKACRSEWRADALEVASQHDLAEILGASFRGDRPHDVR